MKQAGAVLGQALLELELKLYLTEFMICCIRCHFELPKRLTSNPITILQLYMVNFRLAIYNDNLAYTPFGFL